MDFLDKAALRLGGGVVPESGELTAQQQAQVQQGYLNAAQAIIGAMNNPVSNRTHDNFINQLVQGAAGLGEGVQKTRMAQQQRAANEMKLREAEYAHKQRQRIENIRKGMPAMSAFKSPKAYYAALGQELFSAGAMQQGLELMKLGAPQTLEEMRSDILSQQAAQVKFYTPVWKAVTSLAKLRATLDEEGGASSYSSMISFIKNLDDSVVRPSEVESFGSFQGLIRNMENQLEIAQGGGFTEQIKDDMYDAAVAATKAAVEGYERHVKSQSETYTLLGLPPNLIFQKLDYDPTLFNPRNGAARAAGNPDDAVDYLFDNNGTD